MSTAGNDKIDLAPPPRRLPNTSALARPALTNEDSTEVLGAPVADESEPRQEDESATPADPVPAPSRAAAQPAKRRKNAGQSDSSIAKTTLHLPAPIHRRLKTWKSTHGRTTADAVMSSYIQCREAVASDLQMTDEDKHRVEFGLQPLAAVKKSSMNDDGTRVIGLYIQDNALKALDSERKELGLSRSRYAAALLDGFLPANSST